MLHNCIFLSYSLSLSLYDPPGFQSLSKPFGVSHTNIVAAMATTQAFRLSTVEMHNLNQVNQAIAEIPSILLAMISQTTNLTKPIRHNTNIKHKS
jgi:hypothetical protein